MVISYLATELKHHRLQVRSSARHDVLANSWGASEDDLVHIRSHKCSTGFGKASDNLHKVGVVSGDCQHLVDDAHVVASAPRRDRKSVVSGKSVAGRVDLGGRRTIKQKK